MREGLEEEFAGFAFELEQRAFEDDVPVRDLLFETDYTAIGLRLVLSGTTGLLRNGDRRRPWAGARR